MNDFMNKSGYRIVSWTINIAGMAAIFTALYYAVFFSSVLLLEDKKATVNITEGKYIINTLAEEYENILKEKGKNLDVEKIKLLNQIELAKSYQEKAAIEAQLRKIESEKRNFDVELSNNEKQKKEIENTLRSTQVSLEQTKEEIARLNQKNLELTMKNQTLESNLNNYSEKIQTMESNSKNYSESARNIDNLKKEEQDMATNYEAQLRDVKNDRDKRINTLYLQNEKLAAQLNEATNMPAKQGGDEFFLFKPEAVNSDPVVYKGKMYVALNNQMKIFSKDGKILKAIDLIGRDFNLTRPVMSDGVIYFGSDAGGIIACDETGKFLWKEKAGSQIFGASPAASSGIVAVPSIDDGIYIYDKKGKFIVKITTEIPIYSAPLIIDQGNKLIYADENGDIVSYDIVKKTQIWIKNYSDNYTERILYPLIGDDKKIFFFGSSGKMGAINSKDGSLIWNSDFPEIQNTPINPRFLNGKVILANNTGKSVVIIVNSDNGSVESKSTIENEKITAPYVNGSSIFFDTASGSVYSYNFAATK